MLAYYSMKLNEENIFEVLNTLSLLRSARKTQFPELPEEEQNILIVTKEHIEMSGLTLTTFVNTLNQIGKKGYLYGISIFEKKYHNLFKKLSEPEVYEEIMDKLTKSKQNTISSTDKKRYFEPLIQLLVPKKYIRSSEEIYEDDVSYSALFDESTKVLSGHTENNICYVLLSPYRDIDRLLTKLRNNEPFKEIQDEEIWFDPIADTLHYFGGSLDLGRIIKGKEVLLALFSQDEPSKILFYQIPESSGDEFNLKEQKSYWDSMNRILNKDLKLKRIFDLHQDRLEIKPQYRESAH
jgi:hypothetical protein